MEAPADESGGALRAAWRIQEEASALGFDWPDIRGVFDKVQEELGEIEEAWCAGKTEHAKRELGDLLFAAVNLARFLRTDPGAELAGTNRRFLRRFELLEKEADRRGVVLRNCSLEYLDSIWEEVKIALRDDDSTY